MQQKQMSFRARKKATRPAGGCRRPASSVGSDSSCGVGMDLDHIVDGKGKQRFHLVLDLDATLVSTSENMGSYKRFVAETAKIEKANRAAAVEVRSRAHIFTLEGEKMWTLLRPNTREFIDFATRYFKRISVWSAGRADYVDQIVDLIFTPPMHRPGIVHTWDDCEVGGAGGAGVASPSNKRTDSFTKPLVRILADGDTLSNIIILDDRSDIAECNSGNLILIPAFEPAMRADALQQPDVALDEFFEWLVRKDVAEAEDVRALNKDAIFSKRKY